MLDIRKLKELVRLMVANGLSEIDLRDSDEQVTLRRQGTHQDPQIVTTPAPTAVAPAAPPAAAAPTETEVSEQGLLRIESPMVGTFYSAPNPDAAPFVTVGATVGPETNVCVIEAMKIFNEIKAECTGTIEKVLVSNGEAVEFGQTIFLVRPA